MDLGTPCPPMSVLLQQRLQCPLGFSNGLKHRGGEISADGSRYVPLEQRTLYGSELKLVRMIPDCVIDNGKTPMDALTEDVLYDQQSWREFPVPFRIERNQHQPKSPVIPDAKYH